MRKIKTENGFEIVWTNGDWSNDMYRYNGMKKVMIDKFGYKCMLCGSTENIQIHHKDGKGSTVPRHRRNNNIDNLMLVCNSCHQKHFRKPRKFIRKNCNKCNRVFRCKNKTTRFCNKCTKEHNKNKKEGR